MEKLNEKPIALAFSDLEIADYQTHSQNHSRLEYCLSVLAALSEKSVKYSNIPVLFCGDLMDNPKLIDNYVLRRTIDSLILWFRDRKIRLIGIAGNHDQSQKNTKDNESPNWLRSLYSLGLIDYIGQSNTIIPAKGTEGVRVYGIDYMTNGDGFEYYLKRHYQNVVKNLYQSCILLIHTDLPGALDPAGREVGEWKNTFPKKYEKYFKTFNWVLSGHIHKPMQILPNTFMLGAPLHKRSSDEGCDMGYWEIYLKQKPKFIPLDFPKFITLKPNEKAPNEKNYYILPEEKNLQSSTANQNPKFYSSLSKIKLAKKYLKAKGITSTSKKRALIKTLNETEI